LGVALEETSLKWGSKTMQGHPFWSSPHRLFLKVEIGLGGGA